MEPLKALENETEENESNVSAGAPIMAIQDYEAQYFGFTPKSFSDGMYNAMLGYTVETYDALKNYIMAEYSSLVCEEEMKEDQKVFTKEVTETLNKAFDKFESYILTNIFTIPPHVLLPEDEVHREITEHSEEDLQNIDAEIQQLQEKIIAAKYVNSSLRQEIQECDKVQKAYDKLQELQKDVEKILSECSVGDFNGALSFSNEKFKEIRKVYSSLQKELKSSIQSNSETNSSSKRRNETEITEAVLSKLKKNE